MNNEEKKAATIERAEKNKANFELHLSLIKKHIEFDIGDLKKASIEYFLENGKPTGGFLLALMAYAEDYSKSKQAHFYCDTDIRGSDVCTKQCHFCANK